MILHTFTARVKKGHFSIYVNFTAVINSMILAGFDGGCGGHPLARGDESYK